MSTDKSMSSDVSSEPSSTLNSDVVGDVDENKGNKLDSFIKPNNKSKPKKVKKSLPKTSIVFTYLLIPAMLIIMTLSTLNIAGLILFLFGIIHILLLNLIKSRYTGIQAIMGIEIIFTFIILILSTNKKIDQSNKALSYLGFTFNNVVTTTRTFAFVASIITLVLILLTFSILTPTNVSDFVEKRIKMIERPISITIFEIVWMISVAIVGGSVSNIFFTPIFLYFIYVMICYSMFGKALCYYIISKVIYFYSIVYSLFMIYEFSLGRKIEIKNDYVMSTFLAAEKYHWIPILFSCIMGYMSVLLISFKRRVHIRKYHQFFGAIRYPAALICMILLTIFATFYSCYITLAWIVILFIASFFPAIAIRKFFYPVIGLFYNLGFFAMVVTGSLRYLTDEFSKHTMTILIDVGLFYYDQNFAFCVFGFLLSVAISQVGRLIHIEQFKASLEGEPKELNKILQYLIRFAKFILLIIEICIRYVVVGAILIIGITWSYEVERYSYQILLAITVIGIIIGYYNRIFFGILRIISSVIIMLTFFFTISNPNLLTLSWTDEWGFIYPTTKHLIFYIWPIVFVAVASYAIGQDNHFEIFKLERQKCIVLHAIVGILLYLLVFLYETTVFSLYYLIFGTLIFIFLIYGKQGALKTISFFTTLGITLNLALYAATLYPETRNFLNSALFDELINLDYARSPSVEIALLAGTLFLNSLTYPISDDIIMHKTEPNYIIVGLFEEFKAIARSFYFYVAWLLILGFSVCNYYPSCIELFLTILFIFGRKTTYIVLALMILLLFIQYLYQITPSFSKKFDELSYYIGIHFSNTDELAHRNISIALQLAYILFSFIYFISMVPNPVDPKFSESFPMMLYTAFYSMLHYLLKPILELTLCISTLYNPSVFGFLSFVVLTMVIFAPKTLDKGAFAIFIIFNICFIFQYFVWLGLPYAEIEIKGLPTEWGKFFGFVDTKTSALISTCLSGMIFTFYTHFGSLAVNYVGAMESLPVWCQNMIRFCCTNTYEFLLTLTIIFASLIKSFDGTVLMILGICLLIASKFFDFSKVKSMIIASWGLVLIVLSKVIGRIPYFTSLKMGGYIEEIFDIPLDGVLNSEQFLIIMFALIRFCVQIMKSNMYNECMVTLIKLRGYRFMRSRQLIIIRNLDQDILTQRYQNQVNHLSQLKEEEMTEQIMPDMDKITIPPISQSFTKEAIFDRIVNTILTFIIRLVPLNEEAGMNGLTLFSLNSILKKKSNFTNANKEFIPNEVEKEFLLHLPASIPSQLHSVADIIGFTGIKKSEYYELTIRYLTMALRNITYLLTVLISVIYCFMRPYIYSFLLIIYIFLFFVSNDVSGSLLFHIIFIAYTSFILIIKSVSNVTILSNLLYIYLANNHINDGSVNILSLFGINPTESMSIEIWVFFISVMFVFHRLNLCRVHNTQFLTRYFKQNLPGFPFMFCYGQDRVEQRFGLNAKRPPLLRFLTKRFKSFGLFETYNSSWVMYIELISFILLLILFPTWNQEFGITEGLVYVIALILHLCFCLVCYFWLISHKIIHLYITNCVWLAYDFALGFFYCQMKQGYMPGSLIFYLFVRVIAHLGYSIHAKFGKTVLNFVYPDFAKDGHSIFNRNTILKRVPLIYEIMALFHWMSKDTYLKWTDYLALGYLKIGLECTLIRKYKKNPRELEKRLRVGICLIFFILLLIFLPLFFMFPSSKKMAIYSNPPLSSTLGMGFTSMPSLWKRYASIRNYTEDQIETAMNTTEFFHDLEYEDQNTITNLKFNVESSKVSTLNLASVLYSDDIIVPTFTLKMTFRLATSFGHHTNVIIQNTYDPLTDEQIRNIEESFVNSLEIPFEFKIPKHIKIYYNMHPSIDYENTEAVKLTYVTSGNYWKINSSVNIQVWSEKVEYETNHVSSSGTTGIGLYILLVITFGLVLRYQLHNTIDYFWFDKMKNPEQIYKRMLLMEAFRSTGDAQREIEIAETLISLFRSHEKCIELTE